LTPTLATLVLANLLYLAGAVAVASLVSALYVLRHRKPKSLESGIESFSRELRALAPEHRGGGARTDSVSPSDRARPPAPGPPAPGPVPEGSGSATTAEAVPDQAAAPTRQDSHADQSVPVLESMAPPADGDGTPTGAHGG
jgi:hypothetical protein